MSRRRRHEATRPAGLATARSTTTAKHAARGDGPPDVLGGCELCIGQWRCLWNATRIDWELGYFSDYGIRPPSASGRRGTTTRRPSSRSQRPRAIPGATARRRPRRRRPAGWRREHTGRPCRRRDAHIDPKSTNHRCCKQGAPTTELQVPVSDAHTTRHVTCDSKSTPKRPHVAPQAKPKRTPDRPTRPKAAPKRHRSFLRPPPSRLNTPKR